MTQSLGQVAKIRFRGGESPLWIGVQWPAARGSASILIFFADDDAGERDELPSELCEDPGLLVLSASCTHASEAIAIAEWSADHAADLGAAPDLLYVAGTGASARLAASVALCARDRRWPNLAGQVLVDPRLDPAPADTGPYAAPLRARSLTGVAPATLVTTTRDDGRRYADRLRRAHVPVDEIPLRTHGPVVLLTATRRAVVRCQRSRGRANEDEAPESTRVTANDQDLLLPQ